MTEPRKLSRLRSLEKLTAYLEELGIELPLDEEVAPDGPLAQPLDVAGRTLGNRFAILPMEGWDATAEGRPTDLLRRRWTRFGASGAKLIWGGEAYAVRPEGRANPNQLARNPSTGRDLVELHDLLVASHEEHAGGSEDFLTGLQLTHSGRYARPQGRPAPRIAFRHPVLDARVGITSDEALFSDAELDDLIGDYAAVAKSAQEAGFGFVDVKACHGYLGHELLSARTRPGPYGGGLEGRSRFLLRAIEAVKREAPRLAIGVRLSVFDFCPFRAGEDGVGCPEPSDQQPFGGSQDGLGLDLDETDGLLTALQVAGVTLLCTTAGSPYYNPHVQRPAFYPPSDGYRPPEDPLVGVARQLRATAELKSRHPGLCFVGSGYTYLQEWLPHVAQAVVRRGDADVVGLGRMVLSYPELPRDVLAGRPLKRPLVCRTFSDCTTAPRGGLVSGCYPIDPFYKRRPEAKELAELKRQAKGSAR
ncbi:MAG: NADH:flavin oxidoreductase [Deltaproteobacteria bacterium]|nr:NADH:flavin oxidoreductase [Deltaproteobacteria bacterium]MBW2393804.1 NADH:flavin oxidoreductase [Deltaproteobacteria bacterium]